MPTARLGTDVSSSNRCFRTPRYINVNRIAADSNTMAILYSNILVWRLKDFGEMLRSEYRSAWPARRVDMAVQQIFDDWCIDLHRHRWNFLTDHEKYYLKAEEISDPMYPPYMRITFSTELQWFSYGKVDHHGKPLPV